MSPLNRNQAPELQLPKAIEIPEPGIEMLPGGFPILAVNSGSQEVMRIEFIFSAGTLYEPIPQLATAVNTLIDEGTLKHTSAELAEILDSYGAYFETDCGQDWATVTLFTLSKYVEQTLPLVLELITEPIFPQTEIDTYITQVRQRLAVSLEKTDYLARRHFLRVIYGDRHPYAHFPELSDFNSITRDQLIAFHKSNYTNGIRMVTIAGKFPDTAVETIKSCILSSPLKNRIELPDAGFEFPQPHSFRLAKKGAVQSSIRIGMRMFDRHHPDYFKFVVLNTVLGGYFGSRLMSNIREDKGYTYGIGSALVPQIRDGYFFISTDVGADVTENALQEIYHEVDRLAREEMPEEELNLVKNYLSGSFQRSLDGPFALTDRHKTLVLNKLTTDHYRDYLQTLLTVRPADIRITAEMHLKKEAFSEVIIHP